MTAGEREKSFSIDGIEPHFIFHVDCSLVFTGRKECCVISAVGEGCYCVMISVSRTYNIQGNEELNYLYPSPKIIRVLKSGSLRWVDV